MNEERRVRPQVFSLQGYLAHKKQPVRPQVLPLQGYLAHKKQPVRPQVLSMQGYLAHKKHPVRPQVLSMPGYLALKKPYDRRFSPCRGTSLIRKNQNDRRFSLCRGTSLIRNRTTAGSLPAHWKVDVRLPGSTTAGSLLAQPFPPPHPQPPTSHAPADLCSLFFTLVTGPRRSLSLKLSDTESMSLKYKPADPMQSRLR